MAQRTSLSLLVTVLIAIAAAAGGLGAGYFSTQPTINDLTGRFTDLQRQLSSTQQQLTVAQQTGRQQATQIDELKARRSQLEQQLSTVELLLRRTNASLIDAARELQDARRRLEAQGANLTATRDLLTRLQSRIAALNRTLTRMAADRELIIELRKELPLTLADARRYWDGVRRLALRSDSSLGPGVDRIINRMEIYFRWLARAPPENATGGQILRWLQEGFGQGAFEYAEPSNALGLCIGRFCAGTAIQDFVREVLLVVVARMQAAIEQFGG